MKRQGQAEVKVDGNRGSKRWSALLLCYRVIRDNLWSKSVSRSKTASGFCAPQEEGNHGTMLDGEAI